MNKLLRLHLKIYFKTIFKFLLWSVSIPLVGGIIFNLPAHVITLMIAGFFYFLCLTSNSIRFFGDNLTWLNIAPVSKNKLILYNFMTRFGHFMVLSLIPFSLALAPLIIGMGKMNKISGPDLGLLQSTPLTIIPTTAWAVLFIISWVFFCFSILFQKSKVEIKPINIKKLNRVDLLIIIPTCLIWVFYDLSLLIIATGVTGILLYYSLNSLKKDLVLVKLPKSFVYGVPVVLSLSAFFIFKNISDSNLNNPKLALDNKITEIKFQMKFSSYLNQAKMIEFLNSGLSSSDYTLLQEVYSDWTGFEKFLNTHKESMYLSLLRNQKNSEMLKEMFLIFEPGDLTALEIDNYLTISNKLGTKKISLEEFKHLEKTKLSRNDLMNYLVSNNPLKQYVAATFAEKRELNLVPEILRNIATFNDETLTKAKHSISQNYCRNVTSVEIMNAYKNQEVELPSDCKEDLRIPASSK
jgi:hypothetical protein